MPSGHGGQLAVHPFATLPALRPPPVQITGVDPSRRAVAGPRFVCLAVDNVQSSSGYQQGPPPHDPAGAYDFFHLDSVCEADDGNLLISGRNTWAVYKVDRSTGRVIWRMGGKRSNFDIAPKARFAWQHHAIWHGPTVMTLFDNARASDPSRGLLLAFDEATKTVKLTRE